MSISAPVETTRPWYHRKRYWALALIILMLIAAGSGGSDDRGKDGAAGALTTSTAGPSTDEPEGTFTEAEALVNDDQYDDALVIAGGLGADESDRIRRKVSRTIAARAIAALRLGSRSRARRLVTLGAGYASTPQLTAARGSLGAATERAAARRAAASQAASGFTSCDANVSAEQGSTSCEFAQNVFRGYYTFGRSGNFSAYSPATGGTYDVSCSDVAATVDCTGDDGAEVRFPSSAVDSYSDDQADAYAATHDIGADADDDADEGDAGSSQGAVCDPNYSGACVPDTGADVNCPEVPGPVSVVGDDVYGLDRDGDGIGCDS